MSVHRHAEHETERPCRVFGVQFLQGIDGVGRAAAAHLPFIEHEPGLSGDRRPHHLETQRRRRKRRLAMTRIADGDPTQLAQLQRLQEFETGAQMAEMDRIESAAEDPDRTGVERDAAHRSGLSPQASAQSSASSSQGSPASRPLIMRSARKARDASRA